MRLWSILALFACVQIVMAQKIQLRYCVTDSADSLKVVRQIIKAFEDAHPNISVKVEPIADNYAQKIMAMYAANIAPDVMRVGPQDYRPFAFRGALLPLDPFLARTPAVKIDDYYPNIRRFFTYEGKLWALPREVAPTGIIYYNKRLFDEAGLPYPDPRWTWNYDPRPELKNRDFTWLMQQLTKKDENGKPIQYGYASAWPQLMFDTITVSRGVKLWDSNDQPTKLNATDPQIVQLMQWAADVVNVRKWAPSQIELTANNTNQRDQFLQGKLAMYQSGPWEVFKLREQMKDWDMVPFPAFEGLAPRTKGEGSGTAIFSTTRHPEEAWQFVQWMSGPPGMTAMARAGFNVPAIRPLANSPGVWLPAEGVAAVPEHLAITDAAAAAMDIDLVPEYFRPIADMAQGLAFDVVSGVRPAKQSLEMFQAKGTRDLQNQIRRQETQPFPVVGAWITGILIITGLIAWVFWPERSVRYTNSEQKESRSAFLFLIPWIFGLALTFGPMIYSFLLSFAESDMIQPPKWVGLRNYTDALFLDDNVPISIRQTFIFAIFSIPIGMVSALGLALLLNVNVKGIPIYRALFYIPSLASGVAMSLIWMRIFNPDQGILNDLLYRTGPLAQMGVGNMLSAWVGKPGEPINWIGNPQTVIPAFIIMGLWGAGGGTIIYLAGLQGISTSYYEASTIDGANAWQRFKNVTLPLLTPTIFFSLITGVIGAMQVFTQAVVMTDGGPDRATLFYMVNLYRAAFRELKMGYASALAWILFVIILVLTVIQLRGSKRWVFYEGDLK